MQVNSDSIKTVLVANRGEIARRVFRTCRALGLHTVAVFSDADAGAPFVGEADVAVRLPGVAAADTYLNVEAVLGAARLSGANAIHPGYGFLSENAGFAQAVLDAGLIWIGPTPANMVAMATKVEAKALAVAAGVPVLPSAVVTSDPSSWVSAATSVGFPLLVKASAGGGGKGMRAVDSAAGLVEAIEGAQREALSSFGDGTVFLERLLVGARHIEVQVFGDSHGNVVHLWERECSIQRRHQKIVEEAPSSAISEALRGRMCSSSVALAGAIGYIGAGTVEYLVDDEENFYFLEMNTRLQVEHPVTECITGADLVQWQIDVASGAVLPLTQAEVERRGHAIEVRLYAEDPATGFMPSVGTISRFAPALRPGVRWDSGVESGSVVSPHYDPMLAKVIAHAPTRAQAAALLRHELLTTHVHGVVTNATSLAAILGDPAFLAGDTTTAFLEQHPDVLSAGLPSAVRIVHIAAVLAQRSADCRAADSRWGFAPTGWRNLATQGQQVVLHGEVGEARSVDYSIVGRILELRAGDHQHVVDVQRIGDDAWRVTAEGGLSISVSVRMNMERDGSADIECWWVNGAAGQSVWRIPPRFTVPSALTAGAGTTAPVPGRVVAVNVAPGQVVESGQVLVVLEAMKMEHSIRAAVPATVVEVRVQSGDQVDAKQVLVVLEALP
jgi:propionyl-CoA carboxylase alpha chain